MNRRRLRAEQALLVAAGSLLVLFLAVPLISLLLSIWGRDFEAGLRHPLVWPALRLSLFTTVSSVTVVVLLGTPLAWVLAQAPARSRVLRLVETLIQLPIVIPPAVAGVALLLAFGRRSWIVSQLLPSGWSVSFTTTAVVMAEVFVSAPFFVQSAVHAFRRIDAHLIVVARTFGASPLRVFFQIALPMAMPGLAAGAAMSWARSLGEFGATLMFAGNLQGVTQTLPLAIYTALESDMRAAQALSIVLVGVAFGLLLLLRAATRPAGEPPDGLP